MFPKIHWKTPVPASQAAVLQLNQKRDETQVFSTEFCQNFENSLFTEYLARIVFVCNKKQPKFKNQQITHKCSTEHKKDK